MFETPWVILALTGVVAPLNILLEYFIFFDDGAYKQLNDELPITKVLFIISALFSVVAPKYIECDELLSILLLLIIELSNWIW